MNILNNSWLRVDWDGVDESGKSGTNPTGYTNTSGSVCTWIQPDVNLSSDGAEGYFSLGGDSTSGVTTFTAGFMYFGRRYNTYPGINNKVNLLYRQHGTSSINEIIGSTTISAGNLYFICWTSNGSTWKIYVNGAEETTSIGLGGTNTGDWFGDLGAIGDAHYGIGNTWRFNTWGTARWNGKQGLTFTTNTELTQAQVTALYNGGKPISPTAVGISASDIDVIYSPGNNESGSSSSFKASLKTASTDDITTFNLEDTDFISTGLY